MRYKSIINIINIIIIIVIWFQVEDVAEDEDDQNVSTYLPSPKHKQNYI